MAVLTPSGMHPHHVIACAKAGKHVVVEKPMALRLQDADDMIRACDEAGVKLFIVKQNRFNVPVVKAREALEAGRFGRLILGTVRVRWCRDQAYYDQDAWRGTWAYDGGVLTNQASHHVDMLEWFFGDVVSVHARAHHGAGEDRGRGHRGRDAEIPQWRARHHRGDDGGAADGPRRLAFDPGRKGNGRNRRLRRQPDPALALCRRACRRDKDVIEKFSVNPPNVYGFGHQAYYQHVIDCLVHQRAALVDGLEGRKSLELISALYESIETGAEVPLRFAPRLGRLGVRVVNRPDLHQAGVRDVEFGARVKIVEPCNLYGCRIGDDCFVGPFTEIQKGVAIGARTRVQSHAFICELVTIGEDCFVGHGVMFVNDTFSTGGPARGRKDLWRETVIGNRVSIGSNATIMPVRIADDVVIGAGAVVTKDITTAGIYAGNPARRLAVADMRKTTECRCLLRICSCSIRPSRPRSTARSPP